MELMTIIGTIIGGLAVAAIVIDGQIQNILIDEAALFFVIGGTFASTMMTYPWEIFKKIPLGYKLMFFPPKIQRHPALVERMCELAKSAQERGVDSLPDQLLGKDTKFLRSGVQMLISDWKLEDIQKHMEQDMQGTLERHGTVQRMFESMGTFAPIYGLLGTLVGILGLLRFLGDPKGMGTAMAKAIATFYGIFFANFFALPVAGKLETYTSNEITAKQIITEGILGIKQELGPIVIRQRLNTILAQSRRK